MKETKNRNGFRRAALPVFAMLIVAILSLTTVTYAWFTTGNKADVTEFDLNIAAGGGLEVSIDGKNWGSTLASTDISAYYQEEGAGYTGGNVTAYGYFEKTTKLSPVSTTGKFDATSMSGVNDIKLPFFAGVVNSSDAGANLVETTDATSGYLTFALYFRNAGSDDLNVNLGETAIAPGNEGTDFGHLAVRMAFVNFGNCPAHAANVEISKDASLTGEQTVAIFEPNAQTHTTAGINDYQTYKEDAGQTDKFDYWAIKASGYKNDTGISRYADEDHLEKVTTYGADHTYFTIKGETVTQIVVFLWIEGQDPDCTNTIASNTFKTKLQFIAAKAGA